MTEPEWLACTDPQKMLEFLRGKSSDRKLRLFAVACCRHIWHLFPDRRSRKAIEASERFADGLISPKKLGYIRGDVRWAANVAGRKADDSEGVRWIVALMTELDIRKVLWAVWPSSYLGGRDLQQPIQSRVLKDIFGGLFHPVFIEPSWLTWNRNTIVTLATTIYDDRAFDRMPVLADALEEAGCTDATILEHCRQTGPHVRGCWVLDLILGKS